MILTIQTYPGLTAEELAKRCGVGQRQCFRDLSALQASGVPIYHDQGYRVLENLVLKNVSLSLEEALSLIYGLKLVERQRGVFNAVHSGLKEKLTALLPSKLRAEIEEFQRQIEIAVQPAVDYEGKEAVFKKINEGIRLERSLEMDYFSFSRNEMTKRRVNPYQLIYKDGFWYLAAFCHERQEVRLFRVDRIHNLSLTQEEFNLPAGFNFETYLGAAWGMERGAEFGFQVRFWGEAARYVRETLFHPSQQVVGEGAGVVLFTAKACGLKSVARWVLSFGGEAEVIEPKELRELAQEELRKGLERYSADVCAGRRI